MRALSGVLVLVSAAIITAYVFVALVHVNDRYRIDVASGTHIALARYFNNGTLYPELYDGRHYGGTRFMPLPTVLHGYLARVTGEYLVSGKLLSYISMLALVIVVFVLLKRMGSPSSIALGLIAVVLSTETGIGAAMSLRGDSLPLLLQLLAVALIVRGSSPRSTVAAALLTAFAFVAKLTALWGAAAVALWLLFKDRKRLALFAAAYLVFAGALMTLLGVVTDGRIFTNVLGLSAAGVTSRSILTAPYRFVLLVVDQALGLALLLPLAGAAAWLAARERTASIYLVAFTCSLLVVIVVFTDVGTGWNQLIDPAVLLALVLGSLVGRAWPTAGANAAVTVVLSLAIVWTNLSGIAVTMVPAVQEAAASLRGSGSLSRDPVTGLASKQTSLLSEDPYVPVSLDQNPIVVDPFMLLRIGRTKPEAVQDLIGRIDDHEFELIVLVEELGPVDREWWRDQHFGVDVAQAIARSYRYRGRAENYYVYAPAPQGT